MKLKEKENLKTKKTEEIENPRESKQSSSGSSKKRKENKRQEIKPESPIDEHEEEAQDFFADVVFHVESEESNIEESILDPETGMILENNNQKKPYMAEDIPDEVNFFLAMIIIYVI
jgi:hypothetical protein